MINNLSQNIKNYGEVKCKYHNLQLFIFDYLFKYFELFERCITIWTQ